MLPIMKRRNGRNHIENLLYNQHKERIQNMLPTIDNNTPRKHPFSNRRKLEIMLERKKIEYENKEILLRIAKSIQKSSLDNILPSHIQNHRLFKYRLRCNEIKKQSNKITQENLILLQRIICVPSTFPPHFFRISNQFT